LVKCSWNKTIRISPNNYARTGFSYIILLATTIKYLYFYAARYVVSVHLALTLQCRFSVTVSILC